MKWITIGFVKESRALCREERSSMELGTVVTKVSYRGIENLFIDSVFLHTFWRCHRRADRSFCLRGRQFHVCARCTGLIAGTLLSALLFPLHRMTLDLLAVSTAVLLVDAGTQYIRLRDSNNKLRFCTGLAVGLTWLPTMYHLIRNWHEYV